MKIFSCIRRFFLTLLSRDRERREARPRDESSPLIVVRIPPARTASSVGTGIMSIDSMRLRFRLVSSLIIASLM